MGTQDRFVRVFFDSSEVKVVEVRFVGQLRVLGVESEACQKASVLRSPSVFFKLSQ